MATADMQLNNVLLIFLQWCHVLLSSLDHDELHLYLKLQPQYTSYSLVNSYVNHHGLVGILHKKVLSVFRSSVVDPLTQLTTASSVRWYNSS